MIFEVLKYRAIAQIMHLFLIGFILAGCANPSQQMSSLHSSSDRDLGFGLLQIKIIRGMSQAEVSQALGSPDITSKGQNGGDIWIYNKLASQASYLVDSTEIGGTTEENSGLLLEGLTGTYSRPSASTAPSEHILTVIIKFDSSNKVKDFSYHSSKF